VSQLPSFHLLVPDVPQARLGAVELPGLRRAARHGHKIVDVTSLGMVLAAPIILVAAVTCFYFIDRVVVVERTGFLCRSCGYDLWGQTASPCPECGTAFEVADLDQRRAGQAHEQPVRHRRSHREWLGILLLLLVGVATLVLGIMTYRARRGGPTPAPPNAVQPAN
jgi:hypothetical protein